MQVHIEPPGFLQQLLAAAEFREQARSKRSRKEICGAVGDPRGRNALQFGIGRQSIRGATELLLVASKPVEGAGANVRRVFAVSQITEVQDRSRVILAL